MQRLKNATKPTLSMLKYQGNNSHLNNCCTLTYRKVYIFPYPLRYSGDEFYFSGWKQPEMSFWNKEADRRKSV